MIGFDGTVVRDDLAAFLRDYRPGGIILFKRNLQTPQQIVQLTNALQAVRPDDLLLISIDQEGGRVSRLPEEFTIFPPCATVGRCDSTGLAYAAAAATARELRAVGINMNMAPVLDVHTNPANPIIGDRSYGSTPDLVSRLACAAIAGHQDQRVVACGKHFPGHGDTSTDSHKELPVVTVPVDRLQAVELPPFRAAVERGVAALMTAHVLYPALDPTGPATLSRSILTTLLREKLRFQGLIITDDLEMQAIMDHYGIDEACLGALRAGADILLICQDRGRQIVAMDAVHRAVEAGAISEDRLNASVERIRRVKDRYLRPYHPADPTVASLVVGARTHMALRASLLEIGNLLGDPAA